MLTLSIGRLFTLVIGAAVLALIGWLLWTWHEGRVVAEAGGELLRARENWRLWTALGLIGWSLVGRWPTVWLLGQAGERPSRPERGVGHHAASATGSTLYVESHGAPKAPPLILVHGWGMDSTFWNYAKADLSGRFRVIVWDLPGLGKSKARGKGAISLSAFARDLETVVGLCGGRRPVVVGHSIGGMTIQTALRDIPGFEDSVAGVVLLNTTYTNPLRTIIFSRLLRALQKPVLEPVEWLTIGLWPLAWLAKWQSYLNGTAHLGMRFGFGRSVTRSQLEHVTLLSARNPPAAEARGNLAMFHWDATGALAGRDLPTLVVGGDLDIVTKLEASRTIAAQSARGELRVVEGANHLGPLAQAAVYNGLIADFALAVQPEAEDAPAKARRAEKARRAPDARTALH